MPTVAQIISAVRDFAPQSLQESWDNSGLQTGDPAAECTGALVCVDVTEAVLAEAVDRGCNLVLSHHPMLFRGVKTITPSTPTGRMLMYALQHGIAVYSAHTSLDSTIGGISYAMAARLGVNVTRVLSPAEHYMSSLHLHFHADRAMDARMVLDDAGFTPVENRDDIIVNIRTDRVGEVMDTVAASRAGAPVSYSLTPLEFPEPRHGLGVYGILEPPLTIAQLAQKCREVFGTPCIRAAGIDAFDRDTPIRRVAMCGGAGAEFARTARALGAQVYITGDVKYHELAEADLNPGMAIMDIGHYESESCAKEIFIDVISEKFRNFVVLKSTTDANPVKYI